jgi:hypothetical protein
VPYQFAPRQHGGEYISTKRRLVFILLTLRLADLKAIPHKTVKVLNNHNQKTEGYEGVPLEGLLLRAGVPRGEGLRGAAMISTCVPIVGPLLDHLTL